MSTSKALENAIKRIDKIEKTTANGGRIVAVKTTPQSAKKKKPTKQAAKSVLGAQASARGVALPHDCVKDWAIAVADPWTVQGAKIPYNPLSIPTTLSTTARCYGTISVTVAVGEAVQIVMWPGHGDFATPSLDLVAAHCAYQNLRIAGVDTTYAIAPMSYGAVPCTIGMVSTGVGVISAGNYNVFSSTVAASNQIAMSPAVALPFSGTASDAAHTRYRQVSAGLTVTNTTAALNISGSIVSVQPDSPNVLGGLGAAGSQDKFETFPSFKRFPPNKQVKLAWLPRGEDLAWSHPVSTGSPNSIAFKAGLLCWLNAGTTAQTYQIDWVANFEVAGNNIRSIAADAVNFPEARNVVEPSLAAAHLSGYTATSMLPITHVSAANNAPTMAPLGTSLSDQISDHAKGLAMHASKLLGESAGTVLRALGNQAATRYLTGGGSGHHGPFYPTMGRIKY